MTSSEAQEIAELLNAKNQLALAHTAASVLKEATDYRFLLSESGAVIACVQIKHVQWYQAEILHLAVVESHRGQGHAKTLLCQAERETRKNNARVLQCTIRADNEASSKLFEGFGFHSVGTFFYPRTGNNVRVFQKVLDPAR